MTVYVTSGYVDFPEAEQVTFKHSYIAEDLHDPDSISVQAHTGEYCFMGRGSSPTLRCNPGGDIDGDGNFNNGAFDFGEYFEWTDGNSDDEYRAGESVVLVEDKIRIATADDDTDDIIGVISETAAFVGNSAPLNWSKKFVIDDFGKHEIIEEDWVRWVDPEPNPRTRHDYKVDEVPEGITIPEDAKYWTLEYRKESPDYDESQEYIERSKRQEWSIVGLLGVVAIKTTAPKKSNWIKIKKVSDTVDQWLIK